MPRGEHILYRKHTATSPSYFGITRRKVVGRPKAAGLRPGARKVIKHYRGKVQTEIEDMGLLNPVVGHNALRESGPGQQLAFDHAMAHVGVS